MKILWNQNPLKTSVSLSKKDKAVLRLKLIIEDYVDRLVGAEMYLEPGMYFDIERAREEVRIDNDEKSFNDKIDRTLNYCLSGLEDSHDGDCTCEPGTCLKCYAENFLEIDTLQGLNKYSIRLIMSAFKSEKIISLGRVISDLEAQLISSGEPNLTAAISWLKEYQTKHFSSAEPAETGQLPLPLVP